MSDIYADMKTMKRDELIDYYANKYKVAKNLIGMMYDFLSTAKEADIKKIKKGTYKYKYKIKRNYYENGQTLENIIIDKPLNTIEEIV